MRQRKLCTVQKLSHFLPLILMKPPGQTKSGRCRDNTCSWRRDLLPTLYKLICHGISALMPDCQLPTASLMPLFSVLGKKCSCSTCSTARNNQTPVLEGANQSNRLPPRLVVPRAIHIRISKSVIVVYRTL